MPETYEGFANQDTWIVAYIIDNNEDLYNFKNNHIDKIGCTKHTIKALYHILNYKLSYRKHLKQYKDEGGEFDFLKVNWSELAEHWLAHQQDRERNS